jgi:hypothetical protein
MTTELIPRVFFDKQRMIVSEFSTMDQEIVSFFKDFKGLPDLEEKFEKTLKVGVVITKTTL